MITFDNCLKNRRIVSFPAAVELIKPEIEDAGAEGDLPFLRLFVIPNVVSVAEPECGERSRTIGNIV